MTSNASQPQAAPAGSLPTDPMLSEALRGVEEGLAQLKRMYRDAEESKTKLDSREAEVARRASEVEALSAKLEERRGELESLATELGSRNEQLKKDQEALIELTRAHEQESEALAAARAEQEARLLEQATTIEQRSAELQSRIVATQSKEAELVAREQAHVAAAAELAERESALTARVKDLETQQAELARKRDELRKLEEAFRREQNDAQSLRQALQAARQQAAQTLSALQEATARAEKAEELALHLQEQADELRGGQSEATLQAERIAREAESRAQELTDRLKVGQDREARLSAAVADLERQLADQRKRTESLAIDLTRAKEQYQGQESGTLQELRTQLDASKAREQAAGEQLKQANKDLADARAILDATREELEQNRRDTRELETVLDQLRERLTLEVAKAEAFAAQVQNREASTTPPTTSDATGESPARRDRLRLARRLVRERSSKIRRASEVLAKRFEQCEQVLTMRQEVLAAKRSVESAHRKAQGVEARGKAASAILFIACALAILAGVSWLAAGRFAPEVYVARAVLAADSRERTLTEGELEEWRSFHESMLEDPRFLQFAATRMEQQGILTMATPTAVKNRMKGDLVLSEPKPGELVLEYKGIGQARTERELQTLAVAIQSQAREARERRVDGAVTVLRESAKAGEEPIESVRAIYAAGILGAGSVAFAILGIIIWRRLTLAKLRFEQSTSVEAVEDEARWSPAMQKAA